MTDVSDLAHAQRELRRRVATVTDGHWTKATPCDGWNVRQLVVHVIEGSCMATRLLDGAPPEAVRSAFGADHPPDLLPELDGAFTEEHAALARSAALTSIVHHPRAGDITGRTLCDFRTADYVLHGWDLARATGADETLPATLVRAVWEALAPMARSIATVGVYGDEPSGSVDEDAPLQLRLLDLSGRRP